MRKTITYSPEVRERAVRMILEHLNDDPSEWAAIPAIALKIGSSHCLLNLTYGRFSAVGVRGDGSHVAYQQIREPAVTNKAPCQNCALSNAPIQIVANTADNTGAK